MGIGAFWFIFGPVFVIVIVAVLLALHFAGSSEKRAVFDRLGRSRAANVQHRPVPAVLRRSSEAAAGKLVLQRITGVSFLSRQIAAAGLEWKPEAVLLLMVGLAVLGSFLGTRLKLLIVPGISAVGMSAFLGFAPYALIARKRNKRLAAFESQFPDTLDFLARAVRAGHALSIGLELLASDSPEPTRTEIRRVFTEHSLGAPLDVALAGIVQRVPLIDVRFFASAILLQRETGGNLSEILNNLGDVIRQRFMLKGHVRAASAHGRITALALTVIPIALVILLSLSRPDYLVPLREDHHGRMMLAGAIVGQILGYITMKKIINIKV